MNKKLKKLNEYKTVNLDSNEPILNGIECPLCSEELYDSNPNIVLFSSPPQKNVRCSKCDYVGYRTIN